MLRKKQAKQEGPVQLWQQRPPVEFKPNVPGQDPQAVLITARQQPGFAVAGGQLAHALATRATDILLDYTQQAVAMRYQIDGVWEQLPPLDRPTGDAMLVALKQLAGLDPNDRRNRQSGSVEIKAGRDKLDCRVQSQGVQGGERVLIRLVPKAIPFETLTDLGMREGLQTALKDALNASGGMVVFSAPKGGGLTTTWTVGVGAADRFVRDFQSLEDKANPEPEIINVNENYYDREAGKSPAETLRRMILREPDVFVIPELTDDEVVTLLSQQAKSRETHTITRLVAGDAVEAAAKLVAKHRKVAKELVEMLSTVTNQRLARRLCEQCRQGFEPSPQLLAKLGIPAGRVGLLYRPFIPPPIEQQVDEKGNPAPIPPCPQCGGRGYYGRVGIFELLQVTPQLRSALLKTADLGKLREVARAGGHRGLQQEAVMTVARGLTSLEEIKRVFSSGK